MRIISLVVSAILLIFTIGTASASDLYKRCVSCHGADGSKKPLGTPHVIIGQSKDEISAKLKGYKNGTYGGEKKNIMTSQVKNLSDKDIEELAEYISSFK